MIHLPTVRCCAQSNFDPLDAQRNDRGDIISCHKMTCVVCRKEVQYYDAYWATPQAAVKIKAILREM